MKPADRNLGMDRTISRRDLLHGMGALAASTLLPGRALAEEMLALEGAGETAAGYPPALTGLRGSHVGSFETALELALEGRRDWGAVAEPDSDVYDLVAHCLAIHQNGAGAADAVLTANVSPGESDFMSKKVAEQQTRFY